MQDDIIAKLSPAKYIGSERKYVEGALKHIDFLVDKNVNFLKNENADISTRFYDSKLNITHSDNPLRDDIKITIFHEYLHHINYMEKNSSVKV